MYRCSSSLVRKEFSSRSTGSCTSLFSLLSTHVRGKHNLNELLVSMPKEQQQETSVKARLKLKEKSQKYAPGTVALQVLGSGAKGAPRSLYVFTDQSRYIFNCGEGTQRLAHEHKMKLSKLEHIFVTHSSWCNIGGLPGVALTIQDVGVPEITLHGPPGLDEIFSATQRFVKLKDLTVLMADCNESSHFEDGVFTVKYVPVIGSAFSKQPLNPNGEVSLQVSDKPNRTIESNDLGIDYSLSNNNSSKTANGKLSCSTGITEFDSEDDVDYYEHENVQKRKKQVSNTNTKRRKLDPKTLPPKAMNVAMAYICKLKDRPGTLSLERCVEHNVPPGPLLGKLKAGEDITLSDGTVVQSADVRDPDEPGPLFVVVDCPSDDYIPSLVENPVFTKHQATAESDRLVARLVIHFTPPSVMSHPSYVDWMDKFSSSTQHLAMNESNRCMGSIAVHRAQYLLNSLARNCGIFPPLRDNSIKISEKNQEEKSDSCSKLPDASRKSLETSEEDEREEKMKLSPHYYRRENYQQGEPNICICPRTKVSDINHTTIKGPQGHSLKPLPYFPITSGSTLVKYHLRPNKGFDWKDEVRLHPDEYDKEVSGEQYNETCHQLQEYFTQKKLTSQKQRTHPRITFLGTGSCIPNKTRNTSGILLNISDQSYMILDCGEGTYGQLVRLKGWHQTNVILRNLTAIYVSHLHADHHIGLIALLHARREAFESCSSSIVNDEQKKLLLLAPVQITSWLRFYHNRFEPILQEIELIPNGKLDAAQHTIEPYLEQQLLSRTGLVDISTCLVAHCPNAYGISLKHNDWKITYSGDTMPCETLEKLGENSTLLIHEATMEDELEWEARIKMHSTTSQAIEMGKKMKAEHVILTHFSQRYAKVPRLGSFGEKDNVGIAFDNMEVGLDDLPDLPIMIPALKVTFADHHEELEQKAFRRQMRKQREAEQLNG